MKKRSMKINPTFPIWSNAKCGFCGYDASKDPDDPFLYKIVCPVCEKVGCDECMPAGRGCPCLDCEENPQ